MAIVAISQFAEVTTPATLTEVGAAMAADAKISVYIVNKTAATGTFRLAVSPITPTGGEYLYYDFPLKASGTFIAADLYVKSADKVWVSVSTAGWSSRVEGVTLA